MVLHSSRTENSSLPFSAPCPVVGLSMLHTETSLVKVRGVCIYKNKDKSLGIGLIPYPFSRTIVGSSLLGPMTYDLDFKDCLLI